MNKLYLWYVKKRLHAKYRFVLAVSKIMEDFTTDNILSGGSDSLLEAQRKQLLHLQNEIKGQEALLKFLKK